MECKIMDDREKGVALIFLVAFILIILFCVLVGSGLVFDIYEWIYYNWF